MQVKVFIWLWELLVIVNQEANWRLKTWNRFCKLFFQDTRRS